MGNWSSVSFLSLAPSRSRFFLGGAFFSCYSVAAAAALAASIRHGFYYRAPMCGDNGVKRALCPLNIRSIVSNSVFKSVGQISIVSDFNRITESELNNHTIGISYNLAIRVLLVHHFPFSKFKVVSSHFI